MKDELRIKIIQLANKEHMSADYLLSIPFNNMTEVKDFIKFYKKQHNIK
jgi:hypothetical protein